VNTYESLPRALSFAPANASLTGFASNVTGAAWTLTANNSGDSLAHQVSIRNDSATDWSGITITLVGTDANGQPQTEIVTGPVGSATVESAGYFLTLTSATPSATINADTMDIGWVDEFASVWINVNYLAEDILSLVVDVGGTINFTINQTFDRFDIAGTTVRWRALAAAQTADGIWQTTGGATAVQFIVNSYSSGATVALNANPTFVPNAELPGSDVDLVSVGGAALVLGQALAAGSLPVVPASDYYPPSYLYSRKVADGQVKASAGTLNSMVISPTGVVVAGVLTIYDNAAETGTVLFSVALPVTTFTTIVIPLNIAFANGLYCGFDATLANVQVLFSYR
jgi:hypothetical protein